jgi:hypothetical protein
MLLEALRRFESGQGVSWRGDFNYRGIHARSICFDTSKTWRAFSWEAERVPA